MNDNLSRVLIVALIISNMVMYSKITDNQVGFNFLEDMVDEIHTDVTVKTHKVELYANEILEGSFTGNFGEYIIEYGDDDNFRNLLEYKKSQYSKALPFDND